MKRRILYRYLISLALILSIVINNVAIITYAKDNSVSLMFTGDFLFSKDYPPYRAYVSRGKDISKCIDSRIIEKMKKVDFMIMNNEFTYTDRGKPTRGKKFTFRAYPSMAKELSKMGVDLVSLANNHAYDYGEISLLDTMKTLNDVGVGYVGAGKNINEAEKPFYLKKNGIKIAILAATSIERMTNPDTRAATKDKPGVARCLDTKRLEKNIKKAKKKADIVIVFIHWGTEGTNNIDDYQKRQAKAIAAAGADVIVGAHPHVLQRIDYIGAVPVVYSLGNFWFNSRTQDTGMFKVVVSKDKVKKCQFLPCKQQSLKTTLLNGREKKRVLDFMRSLSKNVSFDKNGYFTKK